MVIAPMRLLPIRGLRSPTGSWGHSTTCSLRRQTFVAASVFEGTVEAIELYAPLPPPSVVVTGTLRDPNGEPVPGMVIVPLKLKEDGTTNHVADAARQSSSNGTDLATRLPGRLRGFAAPARHHAVARDCSVGASGGG